MDEQPPHLPAPDGGYHHPPMPPVDGNVEPQPWERYETGAADAAPTQASQRRLPAVSVRTPTGRPSRGGRKPGEAMGWDARFSQLALYKAQKGTCDVPVKEDAQLGRWVRTQRSQYRLRADGKASTMNDERVGLLESIGFDWKLNSGRKGGPRQRNRSWDEWYELLRSFHSQHGHCNVPQKEASGLGLWVGKQRQNFKAWMAGDATPMNQERINALEELGFHFESLIAPRTPWEDRLEELKRYKEEKGNCRVRAGKGREGTFSTLGKWVDRQRQMYKLNATGKKTALSDERIQALEEIGFEWSVPRGKEPSAPRAKAADGEKPAAASVSRGRPKGSGTVQGKPSYERKSQLQKWTDRFEELKKYKEDHGDCRVRAGKSKDSTYNQLGKWCDHQRQLYRNRQLGKPSSMSDDRIEALESIGFQWVLQHKVVGKDFAGAASAKPAVQRTPREMEQLKESIIGSGKKQSQKWYDSYEKLCDYKNKNGNCRVKAGKKKDNTYNDLGKWVDHQRQLYRQREQGKTTSLTDERVAALDDIGFEWVVVKRKGASQGSTDHFAALDSAAAAVAAKFMPVAPADIEVAVDEPVMDPEAETVGV